MDSYKILYQRGYLKGDKFNSPISLKGAEKLASIFERKYNNISIRIIKEKDIKKEFDSFY